MRKPGAVLGLALFVVAAGAAPSFAGVYACPGTETTFEPFRDDGAMIIHYEANSNTTLKVGSCHHRAFTASGPAHHSVWQPGKNAKAKIATNGDCGPAPRRYDGKIATRLKEGAIAHSIHFFNEPTGDTEDIHACIEGDVTFFRH